MKLRGLVPNSYIHVSVTDLYIPTIGAPLLLGIYRSKILECRNWERGRGQVHFWEGVENRIFAVSSPSTDARTGLYCCR